MNKLNTQPPKILRAAYVSALVFTLFWLGNGISGYQSIIDQKVAGYPSAGQFKLYVLFPFLLVTGNAIILLLLKKIPRRLLILGIPFETLLFIVLAFFSGGGM